MSRAGRGANLLSPGVLKAGKHLGSVIILRRGRTCSFSGVAVLERGLPSTVLIMANVSGIWWFCDLLVSREV